MHALWVDGGINLSHVLQLPLLKMGTSESHGSGRWADCTKIKRDVRILVKGLGVNMNYTKPLLVDYLAGKKYEAQAKKICQEGSCNATSD